MQIKSTALLTLALAVSTASAQTARRWAIVEANAPATRSNPLNVQMETRVTDQLTAKLAGRPGITLIDRASIDKIIKEQNFQFGDRSSTDTAVQIGKLLGASQIAFVSVYDSTWSTHADVSGGTTITTGTIVLRATSRIIDVQTGVILAQPSSDFQDSTQLSKTSNSPGYAIGGFRVPPTKKSSGGDPNVIADNEIAKAVDTVAGELASKLASPVSTGSAAVGAGPSAATPSSPMTPPLVAGVVTANGTVYIDQGSKSGIKAGDQFQIVRNVPLGFKRPGTDTEMTDPQDICVLTIVKAESDQAHGTCAGNVPKRDDIANPIRH